MMSSDVGRPPLFPPRHPDDESRYLNRQLIGSLGLTIPLLVWFIAGLRPTKGLTPWRLLDSISAYYYTGAVAVFCGMLVALAFFLFSYKGYNNAYQWRDRLAAIITGIGAVGATLFPGTPPTACLRPLWWSTTIGTIHLAWGLTLLAGAIFFTLVQFPKSDVSPPDSLPAEKRFRNTIYYVCGIAIIGCMLWTGVAGYLHAPIFWPEALALEFFAISWLVKGRADWTAPAAARWGLFYGLHPRNLIEDVRGRLSRSH
jgi:hypothetical protein